MDFITVLLRFLTSQGKKHFPLNKTMGMKILLISVEAQANDFEPFECTITFSSKTEHNSNSIRNWDIHIFKFCRQNRRPSSML